MTYFPDLTRYRYMRPFLMEKALNVGWLAAGIPWPKGDVPSQFVHKLWMRCEHPVIETRGLHWCEFCSGQAGEIVSQAYSGKTMLVGSAEIRVWGTDGKVYAAPNMIIHYVIEHNYRPPNEFIQAVLDAPMPGSPEYEARKLDWERRAEKFSAWIYLRHAIREWNQKVAALLNENSTKQFAKREFLLSGRRFELDAASPLSEGVIEIGIVIDHLWPGVDPCRDVDEHRDKINGKAEAFKKYNPNGLFFAIVFCMFPEAQQNLASGLQGDLIDSVFFVGRNDSAKVVAVRALLAKAGCLSDVEPDER